MPRVIYVAHPTTHYLARNPALLSTSLLSYSPWSSVPSRRSNVNDTALRTTYLYLCPLEPEHFRADSLRALVSYLNLVVPTTATAAKAITLTWITYTVFIKPPTRLQTNSRLTSLIVEPQSGSTGKPKGVLHTTGGYMVYAATTFRYVFNYQNDDVFFCTADLGWITGHTVNVYGALCNGTTITLFEGTPFHPDPGRLWEIVDNHRVNTFYTAPTAIRSLMKYNQSFVMNSDRSSLKLLGTAGEPINPEAWNWYFEVVGGSRCPIVDTFWQTETVSSPVQVSRHFEAKQRANLHAFLFKTSSLHPCLHPCQAPRPLNQDLLLFLSSASSLPLSTKTEKSSTDLLQATWCSNHHGQV